MGPTEFFRVRRSRDEGGVARSLILLGLLVWLAATVAIRLFGQVFLVPGDALVLVLLFVLTVPVVAAVYPLYARRGLDGRGRLVAAISFVLPGMLLDVLSLSFLDVVFPNLPLGAGPYFGAWLLWAYALALLTGLFPARTVRE